MNRLLSVLLASALTLCIAGCGKSDPVAGEPESGIEKPRIAVIPKGTSHVFWKSVEAGARKAAAEFDVDVVWKGPLKENDRAQQISIVEQFVTEGVDGVVLAPLDEHALLRPVRSASAKGIPVAVIDSGLNGEVGKDFISFAATDNKAGGRLAGAYLAELLDGKGKVVLLRYLVGSASTHNREEGFLEVMRVHKNIEVIVDNQYAGATAGEAIQKAEELLDRIREADGVYCPNESSTYGMLVALRKSNLAGEKIFVGFDASPELVKGLQQGEIQGLVVQNPSKMGYLGVKAIVDHLKGAHVEPRIDTGVELVTPENINDPDIQKLVAS